MGFFPLAGDLWTHYGPPNWLIVIFVILYAYYKFTTWHYGIFKTLGIKGPRPIPPFGTMLTLITKGLREHDLEIKQYGRVAGSFQGRMPVMNIYDPDMLKIILVKEFSNFRNRYSPEVTEYPLKKMMHFIKDDHWKHVRTTLLPTFSTGKLRRMQQAIEKCAECLLANLQEKADRDEVFDFRDYCGAYTMDVIASTAFGLHIDTHKDPNNQFVQMTNKLFSFQVSSLQAIIFIFFPFIIKPLNKLGISMLPKDVVQFYSHFVDTAMEQRKSAVDKEKSPDFLQLMVNAHIPDPDDDIDPSPLDPNEYTYFKGVGGTWSRQGLTHEEILAQTLLFFFAGYETTANTLSLLGYSLAVNQDCQDKLIEEIDRVMNGQDHVTYDILQKMPYLDMCLCEAQRLYPSAPRTDRVAVNDMVVCGTFIPKDMYICIPIYSLHHDPDVWPDPYKFNPDRFLPEEKAARNPYYYLPFGIGPRHCMGMRLAQTEMKMAIVLILQKFKFIACEETEIPIKLDKLSTRATNGVKIKVKSRSA